MGAAPMAYVLWTRFLRHAPTHPDWPDRDRFVLSAGHASMLLYSLLHLTGYEVSLDDLEAFRQWGSITPGHPEYGLTPGVEATTGPLGQGFANAVGMAIAERRLAAEFDRPGHTDRRPSDVRHRLRRRPPGRDRLGGGQPGRPPPAGQAHRAVRRQPHPARRADRDGLVGGRARSGSRPTAGTPSGSRTATTSAAIEAAIETALADDRPSLIAVRTHIGFGSPNKQDSQKAHGSPLGRGRGPPDQGGLRLGSGPHVLRPGRGARDCSGRRSRPARRWSRTGRRASTAYATPYPDAAAEFRRRIDRAACPTAGTPTSRPTRRAPRSRRGTPARTRSRRSRRGCPSCSAAPPTCPSRT